MESSRSPSVSPKRPANLDLRRLVGSVNQLRFNDNRGEVSFFGQKMIILRRDVIRVMREGLEKLVGEQATPFLSYLASGIGVHEGSIFRESTSSMDKSGMNSIVTSALEDTNLGLGKIRIVNSDFEHGTARVAISNCFEALENGSAETPNCTFTSGFLAGMFAEVFDKTVQAIETKCMSQGLNECEFQITPVTDPPQEPQGAEQVKTEQSSASSTDQGSSSASPSTGKSSKEESQEKAGDRSIESKSPVAITMQGPTTGSGDSIDQGQVDPEISEQASRIAKRKSGFWNKWFQKKNTDQF